MFNALLSAISGRTRRILGVIVIAAAVAMFAGAILATVMNLNLHINGVKTDATILKVQSRLTRSHTFTYTDVIEFTTPDGVRHQDSIPGSSGHRAGGTLTVVYDPSHPDTVQDASSVGGLWWLTSAVLLLFALIFGWLGRRLWRSGRRDS